MRSVDVCEGFTLGDATDVVLPVALILSGTVKFGTEKFTTSCAVLGAVRTSREDFAHAVGGVDVAVEFDVSVTRSAVFATSSASESIGVHDAARVGSAGSGGFQEAASVQATDAIDPVTERFTTDVLVGGIVEAGGGVSGLADLFSAYEMTGVPAAASVIGATLLVDEVTKCAVASTNLRS